MKIAHLSDLHLLALDGAVPMRLFNKRFTGYINIRLKRGSIHRPAVAQALAQEIRRRAYDHVVVTGDLTNLALEREFETVVAYLEGALGMPADAVSVVPGNHDAYTRGAHRSGRFLHYLAPYTTSDLSLEGLGAEAGFPFVRLRGPVAIVGLSSAVPRPPLVASGELGAAQRAGLAAVLAHREVMSRTPVLLQHHPWHNPPGRMHTLLEGLFDAKQQGELMGGLSRGLLLHGHLHRRVHRKVPTRIGHIDAVGSTSASLVHDDPNRVAGFNSYEIGDDGGIEAIEAFRYDPRRDEFSPAALPASLP